jgi:putative phosphoribosyl transferase
VRYDDRSQAGDRLAAQLSAYAGRTDVVVLGLVRGGVPVAARIAAALRAPLDVLVVRKLGVPWAPEVAFGAIGPDGVTVHNPDIEGYISTDEAEAVAAEEATEVSRREELYRRGRAPLSVKGRTVIVVDDGLATGATARAAVAVARGLGAATVVLAAPVASPEAVALLRRDADEVICPLVPPDFDAVGRFYNAFPQITDDEVTALVPPG